MNDFEFDCKARAVHVQALHAQSPRVRAQLHNRLQSALAGTGSAAPTRRRHATHRLGWASAAVLAVALVFGARWAGTPEAAVPPAALVQLPPAGATGLATLDQDPDFYLWLASSDAVALAME